MLRGRDPGIRGDSRVRKVPVAAGKVSAALNAEYVFILLGVIAVSVAVMLMRASRRHPELKLDKPAN